MTQGQTLVAPDSERDQSIDRPHVFVADPVSRAGIERLETACDVTVATGLSPEELKPRLAGCNVLVVRSETKVTESVMLEAHELRLIGRAGAGVDNIDVEAATRLGILVINAPSGNTMAAAEHTVALMLALARNVAAGDESMHAGRWDRKSLMGTELNGKTLGVVGLGRIGQEVARTANQGLGMHILAYDPIIGPERAEAIGARLVKFDELIRESDFVTVHVPMTDKTRGIIGKRELQAMKPRARVINVARGGIIDEDALVEALKDGHISGAALDVFSQEPLPPDHPFRSLKQVVLTPHLGASTEEAQINVAVDLADQILGFYQGEMPRSAINLPALLPGDMARLRPYLTLARKLGSFGAQLVGGGLQSVICSYSGPLAEMETSYVTSEILTGIFAGFTDERVNSVNAKNVARERGVAVEERSVADAAERPAIAVELSGSRPIHIGGDVLGDVPRVTRIHGFRVDVPAEGRFLMVTHNDRPGVLAGVAGLLADHDVNIGSVTLGRDHPRGSAVMLMEVDDSVPTDVLDAIHESDGVDTAALVAL